jgi:hypothetical protein
MASVFSCYVACLRYASDLSDQLTQSPRAGHDFYSPYHIPDSSLTVELIRLHSYDCPASYPQCTSPLHGTAANDVDVSTRKPRRFL